MSLTATRATMLGLCLVPVLAATAVADPSSDQGGRFTMSPVDGGFLRLDRQTGAVAMCAKSGSDWACKPVEDRTVDSPGNLSHVEAENRELKSRVKELEDLLETKPLGPPPHLDGPLADGPPGGTSQLPSEQEVDQALDYMSRVYKKIRDHIKDLDKPLPPGEQPPPPPGAPPAPPTASGPKSAL